MNTTIVIIHQFLGPTCHIIERTDVHKWHDPHVFLGSYVISILKHAREPWKTLCTYFYNTNVLSYFRIFIMWTKWHFTLKKANSFENLNSMTFETKMSYNREYDTFLCDQMCLNKEGGWVMEHFRRITLSRHSANFTYQSYVCMNECMNVCIHVDS